jgi:hypothetical protein
MQQALVTSSSGSLHKVSSSRLVLRSCVQLQDGLLHPTLSLKETVRLYCVLYNLSHMGYLCVYLYY